MKCSFQGSLMQRDMDDNADGFRDQPQTRRINIMGPLAPAQEQAHHHR